MAAGPSAGKPIGTSRGRIIPHPRTRKKRNETLLATLALAISLGATAHAQDNVLDGIALAVMYDEVCKPGTFGVSSLQKMLTLMSRYSERERVAAGAKVVYDFKTLGADRYCAALTTDPSFQATIATLNRLGR